MNGLKGASNLTDLSPPRLQFSSFELLIVCTPLDFVELWAADIPSSLAQVPTTVVNFRVLEYEGVNCEVQ